MDFVSKQKNLYQLEYRILKCYRLGLMTEIEVIHWCRTDNCVIMVLSDVSVQINFLREHYKLLFWESSENSINVNVLSNHRYRIEEFKKVLSYCSLILRHVHDLLK